MCGKGLTLCHQLSAISCPSQGARKAGWCNDFRNKDPEIVVNFRTLRKLPVLTASLCASLTLSPDVGPAPDAGNRVDFRLTRVENCGHQ